jgi:hypothetical protein
VRVDHAEHEAHGDGCVDGVSPLLKYLDTELARDWIYRCGGAFLSSRRFLRALPGGDDKRERGDQALESGH